MRYDVLLRYGTDGESERESEMNKFGGEGEQG